MSYPPRKRPAWFDTVKPGDVLRSGRGTLRVVRSVHRARHRHGGVHLYLTFTIRHCSWTGRCYTVLTGPDLLTLGFTHTGKRWGSFGKTAMCKRVAKAIEEKTMPGGYSLTCHEVVGVA